MKSMKILKAILVLEEDDHLSLKISTFLDLSYFFMILLLFMIIDLIISSYIFEYVDSSNL